MHLSKQTEYALRLLIHVYHEREDLVANRSEKITLSELSTAINVSRNQLGKITRILVSKGLLASTTGASGGLYATKSAGEISIGEVVELFEDPPKPIDCDAFECPLISKCTLSSILVKAERGYISHLKEIMLSSIYNKGREEKATTKLRLLE